MSGVCLTASLGDRPVFRAKVLQPGDGEKGGSYDIWVFFFNLFSGTEAAETWMPEEMFASCGLKWLHRKVCLNAPPAHSSRNP